MEQKSWSRTSSLHGPYNIRQRDMTRKRFITSTLYCRVIEILDDSLRVKVLFDKIELNNIYSNNYFYLDTVLDDFLLRYGSIESFRSLLKDNPLKARLVFNPPNIKEGKVQLVNDYIFIYDNNDKTDSFSIGSLINGFSGKKNETFKVIKFSNDKESNTGIKFYDKAIHIASESDKFIEVNDKGLTFSGNVSFQASPSNVTFGGLVTLPDFYTGMIPSTMSTPNPVFHPKFPTELLTLVKDLNSVATSLMI